MGEPRRPALRWFGGKWMLAPWVISHFPEHKIYTEAYGGAASVLLRKPPTYAEVYNDLNSEVVNLFRVLQNPVQAAALKSLLKITPYARDEYELASHAKPAEHNEIARARFLIMKSFMGFGANSHDKLTGFRNNSSRAGSTPAHDWQNYPSNLDALAERMMGVIIENRPAVRVLTDHDREDCLHYVDPPYLHETRGRAARYEFEMTDADHLELLETIKGLKGMVVLSGYPNDVYESELQGWQLITRDALADGALKRTEALWLNPAAQAANEKSWWAGDAQ